MKVNGPRSRRTVLSSEMVLPCVQDKYIIISRLYGILVLQDFPLPIYHIYKIMFFHNPVGVGAVSYTHLTLPTIYSV